MSEIEQTLGVSLSSWEYHPGSVDIVPANKVVSLSPGKYHATKLLQERLIESLKEGYALDEYAAEDAEDQDAAIPAIL